MDSPKCSYADSDLYVRMPTNPPLVDAKAETLLELCEKGDAILEPISPIIDNWLLH